MGENSETSTFSLLLGVRPPNTCERGYAMYSHWTATTWTIIASFFFSQELIKVVIPTRLPHPFYHNGSQSPRADVTWPELHAGESENWT